MAAKFYKPNVGDMFELGVALDDNSRGGSRYLHEPAQVGDAIQVGKITSDIVPAKSACTHVFIAGGIAEKLPFQDRLELLGEDVTIYDKNKGERMDIEAIVRSFPWNRHLYVCRPERMMQAVEWAAKECGIPSNEVHFEAFGADSSGEPFEAEVDKPGQQAGQATRGGEPSGSASQRIRRHSLKLRSRKLRNVQDEAQGRTRGSQGAALTEEATTAMILPWVKPRHREDCD
ncbi:hypothetical protein ACJZ2D_016303 [Fusarium nematophilum]